MDITVEHEKPIPTPVKSITLVLNLTEAKILRNILGDTASAPYYYNYGNQHGQGSARIGQIMQKMYDPLDDIVNQATASGGH